MTDHSWAELAAPYALDALDGQELESFEAHLVSCAVCEAEVRAMRAVAALIAHAAPAVTPPAGLRERVLADARRARPADAPATVHPIAEAPGRAVAPSREQRQQRGSSWLPWLAAAAALLVAVGAGWQLREEQGARAALEQRYADAQGALAERDSLIAAVLGRDVQTVTLTATGQPPALRLFLNRDRRVVVLAAHDLPQAPAGRTYQLWGISEGQLPVSLGTFNTGADGRATLTLELPPGVSPQVSAVTEEPAGGSPQPTTTPFLVGSWS